MRIRHSLALAALLSFASAHAVRADVRIAIQDGRVTLEATGATVREILAAWAAAGQTKILNAERVTGAPINLQLQNVPEEQALEIILRSVSGYLAAPRADFIANASRFDRIFVMPTSTPPRTPPAPQPTPPQQRPFNPAAQLRQFPEDAEDEDLQGQNPRGPLFTFPAPGVVPQANPVPQVVPSVPGQRPPMRGAVGVAVPGMIVEPPPPQGQPVQPGQPVMPPMPVMPQIPREP